MGIKFHISINQQVLADCAGFDMVDGGLLDYIHDLSGSNHPAVNAKRWQDEEGYIWTWIHLDTLVTQMPLLRVKAHSSLLKRLEKIQKAGFIEVKCKKEKGHSKLYVRKTPLFDSLFVQTNGLSEPIRLNELGRAEPNRLDERDKYIIDNNNIPPIVPLSLMEELVDFYIQASNSKKIILTDFRKSAMRERLKSFTPNEIKQAITNCFKDKYYSGENDRGWRADIDYIFRSDEIMDRLVNLKVRPRTLTEAEKDAEIRRLKIERLQREKEAEENGQNT